MFLKFGIVIMFSLSVGKRLLRGGYSTLSSFKSARKISGTLHFTKMNWLTPTLRYFTSLAAGLPANTTVRAPAALNAGATRSPSVSYRLSVEQMTAILALLVAN